MENVSFIFLNQQNFFPLKPIYTNEYFLIKN